MKGKRNKGQQVDSFFLILYTDSEGPKIFNGESLGFQRKNKG